MRQKEQGKPRALPFDRKIHFGANEVWTYRVSSMFVLVREPDPSKLHQVSVCDVTGMSFNDIERGCWKRWWKGIGPGEVRAYIEGHLRGQEGVLLPETMFVEGRLFDRVNPTTASSVDWVPGALERRWHTSPQCHLAFKAREAAAAQASLALGAPITRATMCGLCRMRERHS